jgi:hypothetical protein
MKLLKSSWQSSAALLSAAAGRKNLFAFLFEALNF